MPANKPLPLLIEARHRFTQRGLAERLQVAPKTVARWERGETRCPSMLEPALRDILSATPALGSKHGSNFTFIDLFAGIGGIRLGFESAGGKCVFTSEWNEWSKKTYIENFGNDHPFVGDIVPFAAENVPDHDVLLAGFPCQPFSIAGVSKKNALGRPHGFECTTQGTLFFDVARIIAAKRPKAFVLENVKNLLSHDKGNTFRIILETLRNELGYDVHYKVIDGQHFVPQHRERIIIVGFRERTGFSWNDLVLPDENIDLSSILHPQDGSQIEEVPYTVGPKAKVHSKYILTDKLWAYLQAYAKKHREAGNGFGFGLVKPGNIARTLSARYYKDGSEILVWRGNNRNPRRLTPRECARLMGFPDTFRIPVSDTQAYRQFGNSVVVPVMAEVARIMAPHIRALISRKKPEYPSNHSVCLDNIMVDVVSAAKRSQMMSGIRGKNTRPEIRIRSLLHKEGFRYRLHARNLPGKPDIVLPRFNAVIFIHGCFWHGHDCPLFKMPATRPEFWQKKITRNRENDVRAIEKLANSGWRVATVWECSLRGTQKFDDKGLTKHLSKWIKGNSPSLVLAGADRE